MSEFFNEHTYYVFDNLLDKHTCSKMTEQIKKTPDKYIYNTRPQFIDNIAQYNTQFLEKQGYTKKYDAIYGEDIKTNCPLVHEFYTNPDIIKKLEGVVGCKLHPVPPHKTSDMAIQIYRAKGDSANWHFDRSIFNGARCFTFLVTIHNTSDQELLIWNEKYGNAKIKWEVGKAAIIEKFVTYHSVTPLNYGDRILLTLTYTEKPYTPTIMRPFEYVSNKVKNFSYLHFDCFTLVDWLIILLVFILILYLLRTAYYRRRTTSFKRSLFKYKI